MSFIDKLLILVNTALICISWFYFGNSFPRSRHIQLLAYFTCSVACFLNSIHPITLCIALTRIGVVLNIVGNAHCIGKEALRQKAITVGSTVWVVKRNEFGVPISIDEDMVVAKNTNSVFIVEVLTDGAHSSNAELSIALVNYPSTDCCSNGECSISLVSYPITDCFSKKDDAADAWMQHGKALRKGG